MNPIEVEAAVSELFEQEFVGDEFPYAFLRAFGNKETTLKRLRAGSTNKSDAGGILQTNHIHLAVAPPGEVAETFARLKASPMTAKFKAQFVFATDGTEVEAEDLGNGRAFTCAFRDFPNHFVSFLSLAGITSFEQLHDSDFDVKATIRLNRLYVELLKDNPDWGAAEQRHEMNHFMARLIFCFFAEKTGIFGDIGVFTRTVEQWGARDASDLHEVIGEIFRAMNVDHPDRKDAAMKRWSEPFPYVNGGLFSGDIAVPRFGKLARSYFLNIGGLDWTKVTPDIFGSMIQTVAEDEERGDLGMHYTSVPNIRKLLDPLLLDDLRAQLQEAGDNPRMLLNLRRRLAKIRVFDPACGSGNFLVIAYQQMREIETEINKRRGEADLSTEISLTNFRGIEIRDFSAEIARLALIIAKYQADLAALGKRRAVAEFLPLNFENWIVCDNALELDWAGICSPADGETYVCGNPPYLGSKWQSDEQKADLKQVFDARGVSWKSLDYVSGWFMKAADYTAGSDAVAAFVSTNSICQGLQVPVLWPALFETGNQILFAHTSFKWANLASHNAGVTVAIIGMGMKPRGPRRLFSVGDDGNVVERQVDYINAYLVPVKADAVEQARKPLFGISPMLFGNMPRDGGAFVLDGEERRQALERFPEIERFIRPYLGSEQMIQGKPRWCLWIEDADADYAGAHPFLGPVLAKVRAFREASAAGSTRDFAARPHRFVQIAGTAKQHSLVVAKVSSERRPYLPVDLLDREAIVSDLLFALYDAPLWNLALVASRLHLVWVAAVCGKLKTDFRYSNTLGWNTFPVPVLTEKNKQDLTRCAEDILLAREQHYPKTIAELYAPDAMPADLRHAHERNDELLERIYIGRKFRNDTERLEKLFELYARRSNG